MGLLIALLTFVVAVYAVSALAGGLGVLVGIISLFVKPPRR